VFLNNYWKLLGSTDIIKKRNKMNHPNINTMHELLNMFRRLKENDQWTYLSTSDDTHLYSIELNNGCPIPCYMVKTSIRKSQEELVNKIWLGTLESLKKYDNSIESLQIIEKGDNWKIISLINSMPWPIWPRQLVYCQTKIVEGKAIYLVSYSIDHDSVPYETDRYVRAKVNISVHEFIDNNDHTVVTRMTQIDPCGNIPQLVIEMFSGKLVNMFNMWKHE
jgi:hypothetical protein